MWIATCICGHEEEDHESGYGECVEGCLCTAYEPMGELTETEASEEETNDEMPEMPEPPELSG